MLIKEIVSGDKTYQLLATNKLITEVDGKKNIYFQIDYTYILTEDLNRKRDYINKIKRLKNSSFKNSRILSEHVVLQSFRIKKTSSKKFIENKDKLITEHFEEFDYFVENETDKNIIKLWKDIDKINDLFDSIVSEKEDKEILNLWDDIEKIKTQ